jgi:hypothetical protein
MARLLFSGLVITASFLQRIWHIDHFAKRFDRKIKVPALKTLKLIDLIESLGGTVIHTQNRTI